MHIFHGLVNDIWTRTKSWIMSSSKYHSLKDFFLNLICFHDLHEVQGGGPTHYRPPLAWLTFNHTALNPSSNYPPLWFNPPAGDLHLLMHCWWLPTLLENLHDIDGLVKDSSISIANALEILLSFTKPSIWKPIHIYPLFSFIYQHCWRTCMIWMA